MEPLKDALDDIRSDIRILYAKSTAAENLIARKSAEPAAFAARRIEDERKISALRRDVDALSVRCGEQDRKISELGREISQLRTSFLDGISARFVELPEGFQSHCLRMDRTLRVMQFWVVVMAVLCSAAVAAPIFFLLAKAVLNEVI
ncbi:hypothetical protein [Burkholderia gladioli]|uniref:hypothetical protein n=1 Tax=Burkholderia gladioli TaxID=28095 RepID=UPI0016422DF5|nr:hypothetical protein [Burkholderia gladioli]